VAATQRLSGRGRWFLTVSSKSLTLSSQDVKYEGQLPNKKDIKRRKIYIQL